MQRLIIGSLVAAVAMFLLGYAFYGTALMSLGWGTAAPQVQAGIQSALRELPGTGTYVIPSGNTPDAIAAYAHGPVAQIAYNSGGFAMVDGTSLGGGFIHMAVSVFLLGCVLATVPGTSFGTQARLVLGISATAMVYLHFAGPIWYHTDWRNALYTGVADFIVLSVGGLIVGRWFVGRRS